MAIDVLAGEAPAWMHPVVGMGQVLLLLQRYAPAPRAARFLYGALAGTVLPLAWSAAGGLVESRGPWPLQALLLKQTFAARGLLAAGKQVEDSLSAGNLSCARDALRSLVSRPTDELDESLVAAATIESLAENLVDSWIAPLLAYALFGLRGACAYRAINTADAMWGYRTPEFAWLGKTAARLDDAANWLPARLGALLLILCGPHRSESLRVFRRDRMRTSSPNAGQTMAACAGQLGVRLEKQGHYVLNLEGRLPDAKDIAAARQLVAWAMLAAAGVAVVVHKLVHR